MQAVGDTIHETFGRNRYRIIAEVTDVKVYYQRSYAFLTLIEKEGDTIVASAGAVIWRDNFPIISEFEKSTGARFTQNLELVLEVELQYHIRYGLRISITGIDAAYTLGKLEQQRQLILDRLVRENPQEVWLRDGVYRSANHILKLPAVIQRIALIAAPGSDGRRDFLHELENNGYGMAYVVKEFPAQVQGELAHKQISEQFHQIGKQAGEFDIVALVRGGGGSTDFSAFDSHEVSLAVAMCPIPVFSGIGHQRNVSIADLLCHSPQKTPTKCAASVTEHNLQFLAFIQTAEGDIFSSAQTMLSNYRQQTVYLAGNLLKAAQWGIQRQRQWLENTLVHISLADPQQTLKRGYALVYLKGKTIPSGKLLSDHDSVEIRFHDTTLNATINK